MKQSLKISILFLTVNLISAQSNEGKTLKGKVVCESVDLSGIYIINLRNDAATETEKGGYFHMNVAVGDTLMFSAIQIKGKKIVLTQRDLDKDLLLAHLEPMVNPLDEVVVRQYKNINAVSLGIISPNTKHYTAAERKLKMASDEDLKGNEDGTMGASASLDPLFNWMSGRTAMLRKELETEKKESLLEKIEFQFGLDYFIRKLKIPEGYVKAFWYFVVEDTKFASALNAKNKILADFLLAELATKYLDLMKTDNK